MFLNGALRVLDRIEALWDFIIAAGRDSEGEGCDRGDIRRILAWSMDRIGDVQRCTPAIRAVKKRYPEAKVVFVVAARSAPVLAANPWIDSLHVVDNPYSLRQHWSMLRRLRAGQWDLGILLEVDPSWQKLGQIVCRLLNARRIAAFDFGWHASANTVTRPLVAHLSWVDQFLLLSSALGAAPDGGGMEVHTDGEEKLWAEQCLARHGIGPGAPFFLVHPGGNFLTVSRQWPPESYTKLLALIRERWAYPIVLTGVAGEMPIVEKIIGNASVQTVNLCGQLTLRHLIAIIERSTLCIMNDTGPMHIANALKRPTVAILGPTAPEVVGMPETAVVVRADLPCSPCAYYQGWKSCINQRKWECLSAVSPDQVMAGIVAQMPDAIPSPARNHP